MAGSDVLEVLDLASELGVELWIDGGWGVDAALGRQTRKHDDLDILVERRHESVLAVALRSRGFRLVVRSDTRPWNYVLGDDRGREIDFHVIALRTDGDWDYGPDGGPPEDVVPGHALAGRGVVAGRQVRCLTPQEQVRYHTGYEADENDWADVRALCERFDLPVPSDYRAGPAKYGDAVSGGGEYTRLARAGDHVRDEQTRLVLDQTREHESEFLGLNETQARALADQLGLPLRVIAPGDPITFDFMPGRMNVVVDAGRTIEAFAG